LLKLKGGLYTQYLHDNGNSIDYQSIQLKNMVFPKKRAFLLLGGGKKGSLFRCNQ